VDAAGGLIFPVDELVTAVDAVVVVVAAVVGAVPDEVVPGFEGVVDEGCWEERLRRSGWVTGERF
jgi:hypothetical protein